MGYGSGFDLTDMVLILCDDCYKESIKCAHVKNVISTGGNKKSHCFINTIVNGLFGGKCLGNEQGYGCYKCEHFIN